MGKQGNKKLENWAQALIDPDVCTGGDPMIDAWLQSIADAQPATRPGIGRMIQKEVRQLSAEEAGRLAQGWARLVLEHRRKK